MENCGILLFTLLAGIATIFYRLIILKIEPRFRWIRTVVRPASLFILALFLVELLSLIAVGAVNVRAIIGPVFLVAHGLVFLLGTPALANALVIGRPRRWLSSWIVVVPLCTVMACGLILMQYYVMESLYGMDGKSGPYGRP